MNIEKKYPQRTRRQNAALHVLFRLLADALNDAGLDQRRVLKPSVMISWDEKSVKDRIWRQVMEAQLGKTSTTELNTKDVDAVFETINRHLGEKFGLHVSFPSIESIIFEQTIKKGGKDV